jgi:hypothetical protein
MHEHGPNCLEGPIRGSHAWWRGLALPQKPDETPAQIASKPSSPMEETGIRKELVERIRREIASGIYDTEEKWDAALDGLLEHLHD